MSGGVSETTQNQQVEHQGVSDAKNGSDIDVLKCGSYAMLRLLATIHAADQKE